MAERTNSEWGSRETVLVWLAPGGRCRITHTTDVDEAGDTLDFLTVEEHVGNASLGEPVWEAIEDAATGLAQLGEPALRALLEEVGKLPADAGS